MRIQKLGRTLGAAALAGACAIAMACAHPAPPGTPAAAGEIPITSSSPEAVELYRRARDLFESLRNTEAHELYARAVALDPEFALAHLGMADTSPTTRQFFEYLERAVASAGTASEAERWLILGRQARTNGDPATQRRYYQRLVEAHPADARAHNLLAVHYFGLDELEPAVAHLEKAIALQPRYAPAYNILGYAHRARGDYAAAAAAFREYVELLPGEANPYDSYAGLLAKAGRFEEAIENYRRALELDPDFFFSHLGVAQCQALLGRFDEARTTFQEIHDRVDTDGQRRQALLGMALSYLYQGDHERALAEVRRQYALAEAIEDHVAMFDDLLLIGDVLLAAGEPDRAEDSFRRAVEVLGQAAVDEEFLATARRNRHYHLARVALARGDLETAAGKTKEYLALARREIPLEKHRAHELAGRVALERGELDTALRELAAADQEDPRILYYQALAWRARGDREKTEELARRAAEFNELHLGHAVVRERARRLLAE